MNDVHIPRVAGTVISGKAITDELPFERVSAGMSLGSYTLQKGDGLIASVFCPTPKVNRVLGARKRYGYEFRQRVDHSSGALMGYTTLWFNKPR